MSSVISPYDLACYLVNALLHIAKRQNWLKKVHICSFINEKVANI